MKRARLKGFRHNLFDVCYVFSNNSSVLCSLQSRPRPKVVAASASATVVGQSVASAVWIFFGQKLLNVLCAKFCAKKKRVSSQLNKTIVKTIATIVAIVDIATIASIAKLL